MKVLHVIPSLSPTQGGPSFALPLMARGLAQAALTIDVATTDDDGAGRHLNVPLGSAVEHEGWRVFYFRKQTELYKASWPLHRWLARHVTDYDLIHIHALFSFTSIDAARTARSRRVPYIIRPLGLLNRWGMDNRRPRLKAISFRFIERPLLRHAAAIHYTSHAEQAEAELAGAAGPPLIVPLGIDLDTFRNLPKSERFLDRFPQARGRMIVLFLSRLDAKKGLDLLLPAFASVREAVPEALLVIAGEGDEPYVTSLRAQATRLGIERDVVWTGYLSGGDKLSAFNAATVFVLSSYSENFGIALVEALAAGLPCVTTDGVAVSEHVRKYDAGLVVPCEVAPLGTALARVLADAGLRTRLSAGARRLADERFSLDVMTSSLVAAYRRILTECGK